MKTTLVSMVSLFQMVVWASESVGGPKKSFHSSRKSTGLARTSEGEDGKIKNI